MPQLKHDGSVDYYRKKGKRTNVPCRPAFPPYSPDLNGIMEKAWRFLHQQVLGRAAEIKCDADMRRVIREEWDMLAFDGSQEALGWKGINYWADKLGDVCDEVIEQDGFDTKYMR